MLLRRHHTIVRPDSCLSALQQRLKYARSAARPISYFVENVPVWPSSEAPAPVAGSDDIFLYADCNGADVLIDAVCARDNEMYGLSLSTENILITNGGMHALSLVFRQIRRTGRGASAVCLAPVFRAVPELLESCGYEIAYYHLQEPTPSVEDILALCDVSTDLVYLNFPHNPLGGIYTDDFMRALVSALKARGIALVLDMVYDSFIFDGRRILSPFAAADDYSLIYTVNSVSKNYGAPGLRVGWAVSAPANVEAMAGMLETECVAICSPAQTKAASLIRAGNATLRQQVADSRLVVHGFLQEYLGKDSAMPPGGTQVFVSLPVRDVEAFADQMLGEYGLVLATASNYAGANGSQIRIPTGYPSSVTRSSLKLLSEGIEYYGS
jgi:beta-methylarginine biosynthesis bifunctional aminotransferase